MNLAIAVQPFRAGGGFVFLVLLTVSYYGLVGLAKSIGITNEIRARLPLFVLVTLIFLAFIRHIDKLRGVPPSAPY